MDIVHRYRVRFGSTAVRLFRRRRPEAGQRLIPSGLESLSVVQRRAQPAIVTIVRLTATSVLAFVIARPLTGGSAILAPLTALLVVQATLFHTFRSALQRVASVVAGVLLALALSSALGYTWWGLGITIAAALAVGFALRLGDSALEVPISAMLILSLPTSANVEGRIFATLIGAATGMISNLVLSPLRVQPAEEAVDDLGNRLADLLDDMAEGLAEGRGPQHTDAWVAKARVLTADVELVERALGEAEDSVRLNPRGPLVADPRVYLRRRLEVLEHVTLTIRGIARSLNDSVGLPEEKNPVRDQAASTKVASVLRELAGALRPYGRLARSKEVDRDELKAAVDRHLAGANEQHEEVVDVLRVDATESGEPAQGWPLRGELVTHLERLRNSLRPGPPRPAPSPAVVRRWRSFLGRWRRG